MVANGLPVYQWMASYIYTYEQYYFDSGIINNNKKRGSIKLGDRIGNTSGSCKEVMVDGHDQNKLYKWMTSSKNLKNDDFPLDHKRMSLALKLLHQNSFNKTSCPSTIKALCLLAICVPKGNWGRQNRIVSHREAEHSVGTSSNSFLTQEIALDVSLGDVV